jgi:predicted ester cyclase
MSGEEMKATIHAAVEAWNGGDVDGFLSMFDSSLLHHGVTPEPLDEKGNRAFYEGMQASFPGSQIIIRDTVAEDDRVAVRFDFAGEHHGEFLGVAPTGRSVLMHAHTIMRFKDGRVVERWMTADVMGLMNQIG